MVVADFGCAPIRRQSALNGFAIREWQDADGKNHDVSQSSSRFRLTANCRSLFAVAVTPQEPRDGPSQVAGRRLVALPLRSHLSFCGLLLPSGACSAERCHGNDNTQYLRDQASSPSSHSSKTSSASVSSSDSHDWAEIVSGSKVVGSAAAWPTRSCQS